VPDGDRAAEAPAAPATGRGFGRVLVVVYAVFALAATARSFAQILTRFDEAPVAYTLSALAAVIYIVATVALARGDRTSRTVATVAITIELVGVLAVGTVSLLLPEAFPSASVWSTFGSGYLFIPLVLPIVGLWWLRRTG
jgi:cytochrome bd-type quinol oxidase subunit 2